MSKAVDWLCMFGRPCGDAKHVLDSLSSSAYMFIYLMNYLTGGFGFSVIRINH
jgi:hypothetical protein